MSTTSVTDDETCVLALIWTSDVELELFYVGSMSCNREVLCGGIIEDSWDRTCDNVSHNLFFLWWNTLIYCNWRGRFVSGNCHWTVSSEDSCTRCMNWVVGVDLWKVYFNFLLKKRISFLFHRTVLPGCNSCRRYKTVQVQHHLFKWEPIHMFHRRLRTSLTFWM
jgi:hypothetical protein